MDHTLYDMKTYIANHLQNVQDKYPGIEQVYGKDFEDFFFQPGIDKVVRLEMLQFLGHPKKNSDFLNYDHWQKKNPFNFPGQFYAGESDTCGTGFPEAPANVMFDGYYCEYIFKQPQTYAELICVIDAAAVEVLESYSCNGNDHWTIDLCRQWWGERASLIEQLNHPEVKRINGGHEQLYIHYLSSTAEKDLRNYCYFLDNGKFPPHGAVLPDL